MSKYSLPIKHPEWLRYCSIERTFALQRKGKLPESIAGWVLVVALKHPLRAVYGSDLRAAWALLLSALWAYPAHWYNYWWCVLHKKQIEQEELNDLIEDVALDREGR